MSSTLKQIFLVPLDFIHMIQIQLNLSFKRSNAFLIGQFPAVKLILQLTAFLGEGLDDLNFGRFPEQVGLFGR